MKYFRHGQVVKVKCLPEVSTTFWGLVGRVVSPPSPIEVVDKTLLHFDFDINYEGKTLRYVWFDPETLEPLK